MSEDNGKEQGRQAGGRANGQRRAKRVKGERRNDVRRNQEGIAKRLLARGFVERLLDFLTVLGFWEVLDIKGQGFQRKMVSIG